VGETHVDGTEETSFQIICQKCFGDVLSSLD